MIENHYYEEEIELTEIITTLVNNRIMIITITLITTLTAFLITTFLIKPQYQSRSMLYSLKTNDEDATISDLQMGSQLSQDFIVIAKSNPVLDLAILKIQENSNILLSRKELNKMVTIENKNNTRILEITATANEPELAAIVAEAVTSAAANQMALIMKSDIPTKIQDIEINYDPVSPNIQINTAIGFIAGLFIACTLTILKVALNNKVVTPSDIEKLGLTNLATIPLSKPIS